MTRRLLIRTCYLIALICQPLFGLGGDDLIKRLEPTGSITDKADLLPSAQERKLRDILDNLERQTGAALVIVTLPSMEGGQIDDFTNRLFEKWGVGQVGKDRDVTEGLPEAAVTIGLCIEVMDGKTGSCMS